MRAPEGHRAVGALRVDEPGPCGVRHRVAEQDRADGGRQNRVEGVPALVEALGDGFPERRRQPRMLEHHLLLHVGVAVTAARQLEVSFHERTGALEDVEHLGLVHGRVSRIARAAARGSCARVIGLPMTTRSAPASIASRGVRTRACSS